MGMKKGSALVVLICMFLVSSLGFCSCDTTASSVTVFSPTDGTTYHTNNIDLQIQVAQTNLESASIIYDLDNVQQYPTLATYPTHAGAGAGILVGETTLYKLSEGEHTIVVRASGTFFSYTGPLTQAFDPVTVHFFVNTTQPTPAPSQTPTVPEFPSTVLIITFLVTATLLGTVVIKRKQSKRR